MVLIHFKKTEHNQFLYETKTTETVDATLKEIVEINNLRIIIDQLSVAVEDLASYGVMKPEVLRGLSTEDTIKYAIESMTDAKDKQWAEKPQLLQGQRYNEDPHHYRHGVIQSKEVCDMMIQTAQEAKQSISKNLVQQKQTLSVEALRAQMDKLRGAVMIAYPAYHGLPEWEPAVLILENKHSWEEGKETDIAEYLDEKNTSMWWAGKELQRNKLNKDYFGKNEKTKVVVKLNKQGQGMPAREPMVDEETQKKMMAFYYKKQQEAKDLEDDNDDHYLDAPWANPNNLKNQLQGNSNSGIGWKFGKKAM